MYWFLFLEMELVTRGQILKKAIFISHFANSFENGMNPFVSLISY